MNGLPEKIKVTISREDGGSVFDRDSGPQVEHLSEAAPVLVAMRDGGALRTFHGSLQAVLDFIEDLKQSC